ncbi:tetratricopeptide repeat protein [Kitasatospora indigofera]|uniref:tetratricopeptide repeat protein n=1 Tax=Kitasatospora indigofera TaxID=67307 RepID=UPI00339F2D0F
MSLPPEALRPAAEVIATEGLDNLPYRKDFVGRDSELDALDLALARPGRALVQAVHGLGGVGKSALAIHWAATRAHRQGLAPVRWISADSPAALQQGLADLAAALQPELSQFLPVEDLAERAVQWLATHSGWLLILDNVTAPSHIAGLLGRATTGRYLITSRLATGWHDATTRIRLDILDPAEALALLTSRTCVAGPRNMDGADDLCAELGHLPLALEQAAAYIAQNPLLTPRDYLGLLAEYPADMFDVGGAEVTDATIARVWRVTLNRIAEQQPLATHLLRVLAWYAPDHIPTRLLDSTGSPPAVHRALGLLTAYSMVTANPATDTVSVHRLVQALARTPDTPSPDQTGRHDPDPHRQPHLINKAREDATTLLSGTLPHTWEEPVHWPAWRALLPHADALADHVPTACDTVTTLVVLNRTGMFLRGQGLNARALRHVDRVATSSKRIFGGNHPETLTARNNLAYVYQETGDLERAIPLYEQTLNDRLRVLGEDHLDTLASGNNLAYAYKVAGDLERAIPLYEQTLADFARTLGDDHPDTLTSRNNLAGAYETTGDLERAIPLYEQTLNDRLRVLGEDHLDTLASGNNLAYAYKVTGDLGQAIPLYEQTLTAGVRLLGKDHVDTLTFGNNLASAYWAVGDSGRAIPLYEQTLADSVRVLGDDHPRTLASRKNLAYAYKVAGDLERAIPLYEQTLADSVRVLGEHHEDTLACRSDLANMIQLRSAIDTVRQMLGGPRLENPSRKQPLTFHVRLMGDEQRTRVTIYSDLRNVLRPNELQSLDGDSETPS